MTSDGALSTEHVALDSKQLTQIQAVWRTLESDLDRRPMNHRMADRIKAHILLRWLALLLVRVTEVEAGESRTRARREMVRLHGGNLWGQPAASLSEPSSRPCSTRV